MVILSHMSSSDLLHRWRELEDKECIDPQFRHRLLEESASKGNREAKFYLGIEYAKDADAESELLWLWDSAEDGDLNAIETLLINLEVSEQKRNFLLSIMEESYPNPKELDLSEDLYVIAKIHLRWGDNSLGWELMTECGNRNFAPACHFLGRKHLFCEADSSSLDNALMWLNRAIDFGDAQSAKLLGTLFFYGRPTAFESDRKTLSTEIDADRSLMYFEKAFAFGNVYSVREIYKGFKKSMFYSNNSKAMETLLISAANLGDHQSMDALSEEYEVGTRFNQNAHEALFWLRASAKLGGPAAQIRLVEHYLSNNLVKRDFKEAIFWLKQIDNPTLNVTKVMRLKSTFERLLELCESCSEQDAIRSCFQEIFSRARETVAKGNQKDLGRNAQILALLYLHGLGTEINAEEAKFWLEISRSSGNPSAHSTFL